MDAFLLGLSMGGVCLGTCCPILAPYLLGEGKTVARNFLDLGLFLIGRLTGYLIFGVLAWTMGKVFLESTVIRSCLIGSAYIILSALLLTYVLIRSRHSLCPSFLHRLGTDPDRETHGFILIPAFGGLVTGISLCQPFLLAFLNAANQQSLAASVYFFFMFFLGTSIFFLFVPLMGYARRFQVLKSIGKLAVALIGILYLYRGIMLLIGGLALI